MTDLLLDDLAALDALGLLEEDERERFRSLLAATDRQSAEDAEIYREVTVLLTEGLEPVSPPAEVKQRLLDLVRSKRQLDTSVPEQSRTVRKGDGAWIELPIPGVRVKNLASDERRQTVTVLMQIDPGTVLPPHDHHGAEETFVVSGSCRIGGIELNAGDFHRVETDTHHGNIVSEAGCVLLLVVDREDWRAA